MEILVQERVPRRANIILLLRVRSPKKPFLGRIGRAGPIHLTEGFQRFWAPNATIWVILCRFYILNVASIHQR